ncbi:MAG: shikimate dehydrogenase [Nitrospirae bacterium]|nr:shikimate dehydrogenase [Nitrospirota bacterium]
MTITGRTKLVGIIGYPIRHSLSPLMHNAAFEATGLDCCYVPLEVEPRRIRSAVTALRLLGFCGFNVTIPHKLRIMALVDRLSPEARMIGAVNTVEIRRGRMIGHNTDGRGFLRAFREETGESIAGKRVMILGAGGAARAVAFQWALEGGAVVMIANRSSARAAALVRDLRRTVVLCSVFVLPWTEASLIEGVRQADIIINATSVGMRPDDPPLLPPNVLQPHHIVCDLIYKSSVTLLLDQAKAAGAKAVNGLGMLVHQGALAFEIWTGRRPPINVMREALQQGIAGREVNQQEIDNSGPIQ